LKPRARWWWIGGAVLVVAAAVASAIGSASGGAEFLSALAWTWLVASLLYLIWKLWRWMTYRVGVRLLITYFLIGVLPVFFAVAFAAVGVYILMGQYTSVRLGSELKRVNLELLHQCEMVLQRAQLEGEVAAESLLEQLSSISHEPFPRVHWQATLGGRILNLVGGADIPPVTWTGGERSGVVARYGDRAFSVVTTASESGDRVTALVPMDEVSARAISDAWWFDVAFVFQGNHSGVAPADDVAGDDVEISSGNSSGMNITISGRQMAAAELWPPWETPDSGWLSRPLVVWFRVVVDVVDLETGMPFQEGNLVALLRTSPINVWHDFTLSRYELGRELWGVLVVLAGLFLVGYGLALATAAAVVLSITRSTSRLSAGARAVEHGDFHYRVPVKRRDQLGDLARTFNHMADSVQSMLADVAEKERLARELELAREIQESLLPARDLEVGPVTVRATFRPAAEVGGDYFDVFPISENRLVVSIGDVAGHGLSTGLLMASLKSSVAALVHEGYCGADLIEKVNRLLMEHRQSRTLVTMMVVEIDFEEERLVLTSAGHCPALLIDGEGEVEELMAVSLPMGNPLCSPASLERQFASESQLILYSDGLVEAVSPDGEPFGYQRLEELVRSATDISGRGLTGSILDALADFTDGVPAADDLTILVVERT
jgi:HAMP domain-containing protein